MKSTRKNGIVGAILLVVFVLSLVACKNGVAATALRQAREHFATAVGLENQMKAQYRVIQTEVSTGYSTISLNNQLALDCFSNAQEVIEAAMAGRYGENVGQGPSDGGFNQNAFINAFAVNEAYPGDITLCQQALLDVAQDIRVWNADKSDNFGVFWDLVREYDTHIHGDIVRSLQVQLLQVLEEAANDAEVPLPDYVYPTFNLSVSTADQEICSYYTALSGDCVWNAVFDRGTLTGQAAYEYMTRPILAQAVQQSFDSGIDDLNPLDSGADN